MFHGGNDWNAFDVSSKKRIKSEPQPDRKLKKFDGITSDGNGGFLVTLIGDDRIWHIRKDGLSKPLSEEKLKGIDLQYLPGNKRLILPQVGGGLSVFRLKL